MTIKDNVEQRPISELSAVEIADALATEYAMLVEARAICRKLSENATGRGFDCKDAANAMREARVSELWDQADDAIFDALNAAYNIGDDQQAGLAMQASRP